MNEEKFNTKQEEQIRLIIRDELQELLASDRYIFHKNVQFLDGRNIQTGLTTGTKIGTSTSQKIGFWNKTPVIQPTSSEQAALNLFTSVEGVGHVDPDMLNSNFSEIETLVNRLRTDLVNVGIIKGS